ncbi:hypothetical protein D3C81_2005810 [compost metagenome]
MVQCNAFDIFHCKHTGGAIIPINRRNIDRIVLCKLPGNPFRIAPFLAIIQLCQQCPGEFLYHPGQPVLLRPVQFSLSQGA